MSTELSTPVVDERTRDLYRAALAALDAGQLVESEALWRELLAEASPERPCCEPYALGGLATLYARTGRDFESVVLLRYLADYWLERSDGVRAAGTLVNLALMLSFLHPYADASPVVAELQEVLDGLPPEAAVMAREDVEQVLAFEAIQQKDRAGGEAAIERFASAPTQDPRSWRKRVTTLQLRAGLDVALGDGDAALAWLDQVEGTHIPCPGLALSLLTQRIEAALATSCNEQLLREAWRGLDVLRRSEGDEGVAACRISLATVLAKALERLEDDRSIQDEVQDQLATAILQRIAQLDAALRILPELGLADAPAATLLAPVRRAFRREQRVALERVAARIRATGEAPHAFAASFDRGWVRLCAWCERVAPREGVWVPLGHYVPVDPAIRLTHTICPACSDQLVRDSARA
ncbi:MAG: hypothetical protein R3F05_06830 [Planctomycetota bacterium]